jgi:type I restriction enzyme M protein
LGGLSLDRLAFLHAQLHGKIMSQTIKLSDLLRDSAYKLTQFKAAQIQALEARITLKETAKSPVAYVNCLVRGKLIKLTPEEIVRQLYLMVLTEDYGYPIGRIQLEYPVQTGSSTKRADIVIFEASRPTQAYIIVELKEPNSKEGRRQLESYCKFEGASIGVWCNGNEIEYFFKQTNAKSNTTFLERLTYLPNAGQNLSDVLDVRFTIKQLLQEDKLQDKPLKNIILEFEDIVLANSGVDSFEEIFKLLFTKLYDEYKSSANADEIAALLKHKITLDAINDGTFRQLEFRNTGTETEVSQRLSKLFDEACKKWKGIFPEGTKFSLTPTHLKTCISYLQDVKLFNSNLEVVDDAFEYLVNKEQKGDKGQYFTPRYVIDMCVKMLNPHADETMIDTAAGSCGFPMHTIFHVWNQLNPHAPNLLTTQQRTAAETEYVQNKVFAIDFDLRSVRVGRALNIIAGDGQTNVLLLNTLDFSRWDETVKDRAWLANYNTGFTKLEELRVDKNSNQHFNFDVLMANPPFAGDISDDVIIHNHPDVAKKPDGKYQSKISRDVLFIERNLNFLKAGGRMAVVLPQGRFNNSSDKNIRQYIAQNCRILAVVGLHGNVFKPHTGTKTSVLLVQKWNDDPNVGALCPKQDDYPIFFATMKEPSKDNSGEKIYRKDPQGNKLKDDHGHFIVQHDLFSTRLPNNEKTPDGIAEAFIEFAKKERLSFFH